MKADPVIDAIRVIRHQNAIKISASVGHDPRKLVEHYRQLQKRYIDGIVSGNVAESKPKDGAA